MRVIILRGSNRGGEWGWRVGSIKTHSIELGPCKVESACHNINDATPTREYFTGRNIV